MGGLSSKARAFGVRYESGSGPPTYAQCVMVEVSTSLLSTAAVHIQPARAFLARRHGSSTNIDAFGKFSGQALARFRPHPSRSPGDKIFGFCIFAKRPLSGVFCFAFLHIAG
jgi:hypothetical protein